MRWTKLWIRAESSFAAIENRQKKKKNPISSIRLTGYLIDEAMLTGLDEQPDWKRGPITMHSECSDRYPFDYILRPFNPGNRYLRND